MSAFTIKIDNSIHGIIGKYKRAEKQIPYAVSLTINQLAAKSKGAIIRKQLKSGGKISKGAIQENWNAARNVFIDYSNKRQLQIKATLYAKRLNTGVTGYVRRGDRGRKHQTSVGSTFYVRYKGESRNKNLYGGTKWERVGRDRLRLLVKHRGGKHNTIFRVGSLKGINRRLARIVLPIMIRQYPRRFDRNLKRAMKI